MKKLLALGLFYLVVGCAQPCLISNPLVCINEQNPKANLQLDFNECTALANRLDGANQTMTICMRERGWHYGRLGTE